jgi:glucans biosynthesis protein
MVVLGLVHGVALCRGISAPAAVAEAPPFGLDQVAARAKALAERAFEDPTGRVPRWLLEISYDEWRQIRFRPTQALWRSRRLPFTVQFFHPGLFYDRPVAVHVVDADGVHPVAFSPSQFDYGENHFASKVPQDLGYAGLRLHYPIKTPEYHDEVIAFVGATYFRAVGRDQGFGLSARGLAVNTALPSGEEFPYFREFWLVRPTRAARAIAVYALLDSPSLTGAYRFEIRPGEQTLVDVDARLFVRRPVEKLGIAPLTSMFFFGENTTRTFEDFRPEVHDSDGLLVQTGAGEWIWRPLDNPRTLLVNGFSARDPRGFGLMQRDRDFDHYQDPETRPELRPSLWVAPRESWGAGRVELVQIPTRADANDNIVAYWVPEAPVTPERPLTLSYRLHWYGDDPARPPGGRVVATRRDRGTYENAHRFVVDFMGERLKAIPAGTVLRAVVTVGTGGDEAELLEQQVYRNPVTGGWRLVCQVRLRRDEPVELRAFLQLGADALTETWSYTLVP